MKSSTAENAPAAHEIGKYRIIAQLAKGGMGNVYLAMGQGPGGFYKLVAVKELKREYSRDEAYVAMFLEEACLAARLNHPNIVQTYEFGSEGDRHFMIMEYLEGRTLHRAIRQLAREGGLPLAAHLRVIADALRGLHHAHELRGYRGEALDVVHRDVSPMNVLMTFDGQAKVLDFGIAKSIDSEFETRTGVLKGRVAYMAPEQACGGKVDRRADVYSIGVMIWEAVAGRRLWPDMTDVDILTRVLREGPPSLRSVCPSAPPELDAICARAMARDPDERYPTAALLAEDLEAHLARRDDAMSSRETGALFARAFADERAKMNTVLDTTIASVRYAGPPASVRNIHTRSGTHRLRSDRASHDPASLPAVSVTTSQVDSSLQVTTIAPSASGGRRPAPDGRRNDVAAPFGEDFAVPVSLPAGPVLRWGRWIAAAMIGLTLPAASLAVLGRAHVSAGGSASASPEFAPPPVFVEPSIARALPPPTTPEGVDVVVRATPSIAQISLDGKLVPTNPYRAHYPKDGLVHRITVSADGYETKLDDVVFSGDVSVDVSLDRRPGVDARSAAAGSPGRSARAASDPKVDVRPAAPPGGASTPSTAGARSEPARASAPRPGSFLPIATSNPYYVP